MSPQIALRLAIMTVLIVTSHLPGFQSIRTRRRRRATSTRSKAYRLADKDVTLSLLPKSAGFKKWHRRRTRAIHESLAWRDSDPATDENELKKVYEASPRERTFASEPWMESVEANRIMYGSGGREKHTMGGMYDRTSPERPAAPSTYNLDLVL